MPLGNRNIEPTCLGAHEVPQESESERKTCLLTVANNAIVGTLLQLSSLVRHADDLFCDISDECQKVFERTDKLVSRIKSLDKTIGKLDAKQVVIPEGNLREFTTVTHHHEARHGFDSHVFLSTNRPQCVQDQYNLCATNPTRVIRSADRYRKDGLSGSKMFKCWPVILQEQTVRTPDLNMPRRIQRVRSFEKKYKEPRIRERPKTIHGWDDFILDEQKKDISSKEKNQSSECLITTEPPVVVTIDTSGSNFQRMQLQRASGRRESKEEREKKKRRRRTVSGVPESLMSEIERFDRRKRVVEGKPRRTPRSYSFDDLDAEDGDIQRDEGIVKYLDELDGKMEERLAEEKAQKIMKFFPCRRSRSLPRCIKLVSVSRSLSSDRKSQRDMNTTYESSSLSIASLASNASSRLSRATKRSSMLSNKLKSLVSGNVKDKPKPRPKSLDIDTFLDAKPDANKHSIAVQGRSKSTYSLERNHTPLVPQNLLEKQCNGSQKSDSTIGPGSYYNFESSTLPRAQAKKYDFPWESLPKDWTTSVKLREISKRRAKEDRQSSSGNWSQSGTSSNRHSLDSDLRSDGIKCNSQYSLGKDSGRDSLTLEEENDCVTDSTSTAGYAGDGTSTIVGSSDSVSVGNPKSDFTQLDTEAWIQSLAVRAAKHEQADSATLSRLTRQNILALDLMLCDEKTRKRTEDESSQFSVDQEGFFTSFHNDSGLKKSTNTLVDEEDYSPTKDTISVCSAESVIHRPEKGDKFAGLRKGSSSNQNKVLSKVTPPTAPNQSPGHSELDSEGKGSSPELKSFPSQDSSSVSESDAEAVFTRVHDKTQLSSTGFPSYVALSTSDDESSPDSVEKSKRRSHQLKGLSFNQTVSETGLNSDVAYSFGGGRSLSSTGSAEKFSPLEPSLKHSQSVLECTQQGYDNLTQVKSQPNFKTSGRKSETSYQSWPRSHKSTPTSGILKTPEKQPDPGKPQKSLNFAPIVNLFNPGAQGSVQMPLPSPTNSSSSECSFNSIPTPHLNTFQSPASQEQSYQLTVPIKAKAKSKQIPTAGQKSNVPLKYQPVITVTPRSRSGDRQGSDRSKSATPDTPDSSPIYAKAHPKAQSTPNSAASAPSNHQTSPMLYAVSPVLAQKNGNQAGSHNRDSGYMDMQSLGSIRSAESNSSLASSECLSFSDGSPYMSMSSPTSSPNLSNMEFSISSTPSGSLDSLLDMRKTPTNELETDTYHINTSLHYNSHHGKPAAQVETVPIVTQGNTSHVNVSKQQVGHQSMSSFRAPEGKSANSSFSSYKSGRRSVDSADLTHVTQMSLNSSRGSVSTPVNREVPSSKTPRQVGRQSRVDTRHEPSYRSHNASNRRSLPSDAINNISYAKNVPLKATGNTTTGAKSDNKTLSSSKSCPIGFNALAATGTQNGPMKAPQNRHSQNYGRQPANPTPTSQPAAPVGGDSRAGGVSHRSDSYRVAMASENMRNGSYRVAMHQSKSFPSLPPTRKSGPYRVAMDMSPHGHKGPTDDDVMSRADSYRIAVRNTQGLVEGDTSYRVAVDDDSSSGVSMKFKTLSLDNHKSVQGRKSGVPDRTKELISKPVLQDQKPGPQSSKGSNSGRIRKVTKQDVDPIQIVQTVDNNKNESKRSNKNNQNRSSTYIQFDPIFEDTEDFPNATEALRIMSTKAMEKEMSPKDYSANISSTSKSKYSLVNGHNVKDANANHVKGPKKPKSGKGVEIEDDWRFSQV